MIVTLTKDLKILDLFLKSVENRSQTVVGVDTMSIIPAPQHYDCRLIEVDEIYKNDFLSKFTTFKKCILINHLIEQGYRNFLFSDDDCIILKPINMEHTRLRPIDYVDLSKQRAANIMGCKGIRYEAGNFVLNLSEKEAKLYSAMFWEFVETMKNNSFLFLPVSTNHDRDITECHLNMFFADNLFLSQYFEKISKVEDKNLAMNMHELKKYSFKKFKDYLRNSELDFEIFHFNAINDKCKYMELFYAVMREKCSLMTPVSSPIT